MIFHTLIAFILSSRMIHVEMTAFGFVWVFSVGKDSKQYNLNVLRLSETNQIVIMAVIAIFLNQLQKQNMKITLILFLLSLTLAQRYLSEGGGPLPIADVYIQHMSRKGKTDFWKVNNDNWIVPISAHALIPGAITKVKFELLNGNRFEMGCVKANTQNGAYINKVGYVADSGTKVVFGEVMQYGSPASVGDVITMTVDLRPYENTLSFAKNGLDMGIAFQGLNLWGDEIYVYFAMLYKGHKLRVIGYEVEL